MSALRPFSLWCAQPTIQPSHQLTNQPTNRQGWNLISISFTDWDKLAAGGEAAQVAHLQKRIQAAVVASVGSGDDDAA